MARNVLTVGLRIHNVPSSSAGVVPFHCGEIAH